MRAILGVGTNIGNKKDNIIYSLKALSHLPSTEIVKLSSVYETEPWGFLEQDNFYNICIEIETGLSPNALLGACLGIEAAAGRERPFKNAPRVLDMDVLIYESFSMNEPELMLPHPRIGERAFVLVPLKDISDNMNFYGFNYEDYYKKCDKSGVNKVFEINVQEIKKD